MNKINLIIIILLGTFTLHAQTPQHITDRFTMIWHDEFNGEKLDTFKWQHRSLGKRFEGYVVEEACYLDKKGHLVIEVSRPDSTRYHIGQIATQNTFLTTFGYFECRAKVNKELGPHVAFWLQSPSIKDTTDNPQKYGTEIDIFEYHRNGNKCDVHHNLHWNGYGEHHKQAGSIVQVKGIDEGFHTFGLEWNKEEYIFYVDGKETWRTNEAVSHIPEYLLLSAELTGWGGDFTQSNFPDEVVFDYVRVYKEKNDE